MVRQSLWEGLKNKGLTKIAVRPATAIIPGDQEAAIQNSGPSFIPSWP